jgi:hypothetical protein
MCGVWKSTRAFVVLPEQSDPIQMQTAPNFDTLRTIHHAATESNSLGILYLYDARDPLRYCLRPSMPSDNTMPPGEPVPGPSISTMPADLWDGT